MHVLQFKRDIKEWKCISCCDSFGLTSHVVKDAKMPDANKRIQFNTPWNF